MLDVIRFLILVIVALIHTSSGLPSAKIYDIVPGREKIVGGVEAKHGEVPWIVDMRRPTHYCAGSIVNSEWVVTAAHCSQGAASSYTLVAGEHRPNEDDGTEQTRKVVRIVNHPAYNPSLIENDIAMMQVDPPFQLNDYVQPIRLAKSGFSPDIQVHLNVSGWGRLTEGGISPTTLMKVSVPFVPELQCRAAYGDQRIKETMLCASEGGKDACQGDSGGPLTCRDNEGINLCGIVSWGTGCARPAYPGVYTEVSYYGSWVESVIGTSA